MITLFEDINENTNRMARENHSPPKAASKETRLNWHQKISSWLFGRSRLHSSEAHEMDRENTHSDVVLQMKLTSGQEELPKLALTKING